MKILLTAINAKYIHSNLAVYSLQAYAAKKGIRSELAEYTINQRTEQILEDIYRKKPEVLVFSCYIWNVNYVTELAREFHKLCPKVPIWAGGPEVSFETECFLKEHPEFTGVMMGEGEKTFAALCRYYVDGENLSENGFPDDLGGISFRGEDGGVKIRPLQTLLDMDDIPFCYKDIEKFTNKIIYYESSRGCPFRCSYCLSSVDKTLRYRSLPLVFKELQFFLDHRVPQVKFVDRTFNCCHEHAFGIWNYLKEHDNGVTNFHFEVSADLLTEEELALIETMRPGLIQLEIGVQSTHPETIREIHRSMSLDKVCGAVKQVKTFSNTHQHLDLIAGLPLEDYDSFRRSFDDIYAWKPDQLQLGFLKVLKGSYMYEHAAEYGILYRSEPPYEVLATNWLSYDEVLQIKAVEEMLEIHYNSGQFSFTMAVLEENYDSAFSMFLDLAEFYKAEGYLEGNHTRVQRADILLEFAGKKDPARETLYCETLLFDLYKIEKSKKRPEWAPDTAGKKKMISEKLRKLGLEHKYCHAEPFSCLFMDSDDRMKVRKADDGIVGNASDSCQWILFNYEKRNPLSNEAARFVLA